MAIKYGTQGSDTISGTENNDILYGWAKGANEYSKSGNDKLYGKAGNDKLYGGTGNDILDGGAGIDTLIGGKDNDTYIVDSTTDIIKEYKGGGIDTVKSSVSYKLGDWLDNLTLTGNKAINGTGNSLNNKITGNDAENILKGGAGNDTVIGGRGDTLFGEAGSDRLIGGDYGEGGADIYGGDGNDSLSGYGVMYGEKGNDKLDGGGSQLYGGSGNDTLSGDESTLYGGDGNDVLTGFPAVMVGGKGNDIINCTDGNNYVVFNRPTEGIDTINGFLPGDDTIWISASGFGGELTPEATITPEQFVIGTGSTSSDTRFIYNNASGALYFDVDGTGIGKQVQLATLTDAPAITNNDIFVLSSSY